jgi:hypothetical protein
MKSTVWTVVLIQKLEKFKKPMSVCQVVQCRTILYVPKYMNAGANMTKVRVEKQNGVSF